MIIEIRLWLAYEFNISGLESLKVFLFKGETLMFNENERPLSVSEVRSKFHTFFDLVRYLHNGVLFKNDQSTKVEDIKRYGDELFEANQIEEYLHNLINEAIEKFSQLLIGEIKKLDSIEVQTKLKNLLDWINLAIDDVVQEIDISINDKN